MSLRKRKPVYCRHSLELEIPFFDVDAMHIVWHGHYVKYLEQARCAFLETLNYTYDHMRADGHAWPIVHMNLKYIKPAVFRQRIRIELMLVEYESCLKLDYVIYDSHSGRKLTRASTTQVAVRLDNGEMQFQTPDSWQQAVRHYIEMNN